MRYVFTCATEAGPFAHFADSAGELLCFAAGFTQRNGRLTLLRADHEAGLVEVRA